MTKTAKHDMLDLDSQNNIMIKEVEMGRIMMTKKAYEAQNQVESQESPKKGLTLLGMILVMMVASSAISWIGFMTIKMNGGKLPWEQ